jgi:tetratricopeptide (TPR) repeat protein
MKNKEIVAKILVFLAMWSVGCNISGVEERCSTKVPAQAFLALSDSIAYDYIKYSLDNDCEIDSSLASLFALRSIGSEDKYFLMSYDICCEKSAATYELGLCNCYLAEHYFYTNRFELAAKTYGKVLTLFLENSDSLDFFKSFSNLNRHDQNLYLSCLLSRANTYSRMKDHELVKKDLDIGLKLSRTINPIFIESFERGFN